MSLPGDVKIDVLKMLMQEDRTEARIIRARIENVVWSIVAASLAITAFLLKPPTLPGLPIRRLVLLSDVLLLLGLIVVTSRSMLDLRHHRKAQEARQDLFLQVANGKDVMGAFDPFPDTRQRKSSLEDHDMCWTIGAGIALMALKIVASFILLA